MGNPPNEHMYQYPPQFDNQSGEFSPTVHTWKAFKCKSRSKQITISKIIHDLAHTNLQDKKFHGTSSTCPICLQEEETFLHVLHCLDTRVVQCQHSHLRSLESNLTNIYTPPSVTRVILHGFSELLYLTSSPKPRAHTAGSLWAADILLTSVF